MLEERSIPIKLETIPTTLFVAEDEDILKAMDYRLADKKVYCYYYCDVKDGKETALPIPFGSVLTACYDGASTNVSLFLSGSPFATFYNCSNTSPLKFKKKEIGKNDFIMSNTFAYFIL